MQRDIRKLSIGKDYPNMSMHYQIGKTFRLQDTEYTVSKISENIDFKKEGRIAYDIFLTNSHGTILWKTIIDMPMIIEDNIDFE